MQRKHLTIDVEETFARLFLRFFAYTNQIWSPSSTKTSFKQVWPYFYRYFAKYVFARPGSEKGRKSDAGAKGAKQIK